MNTMLIIGAFAGAALVALFAFILLEHVYDAGYDEGYAHGREDKLSKEVRPCLTKSEVA